MRSLALTALLLTVAVASQQLTEETDVNLIPKMPVYLGIGYNLLKGNPLDDHVDEGFAHPIYKVTYHKNQTTTDNRYIVPDNITHRVVSSCSFATAITEHRGTMSYQKSLMNSINVHAGMSLGLFEASFSFSRSY